MILKTITAIALVSLFSLSSSFMPYISGEIKYSTARKIFISDECDDAYECPIFDQILEGSRPAYLQRVTYRSILIVMRTNQESELACRNVNSQIVISKIPGKFPRGGRIKKITTKQTNTWFEKDRAATGRPRCETIIALNNLEPHTQYKYSTKVGKTTTALNAVFTTPPRNGDKRRPVHFFAMGDLGPSRWKSYLDGRPKNMYYAVNNVLQKISRIEPFHLGILLGDLDNSEDGPYWATDAHLFGAMNSYASKEDLKSLALDKTFNNKEYLSLMSGIPIYVTPGNHDCRKWGHRGAKQPIFDDFVMPSNGRPCKKFGGCDVWDPKKNHHDESYYSFDIGNIHFVSLNIIGDNPDQTSLPGQKNCSMPDWMTGDLDQWRSNKFGSTMIRWFKDDMQKVKKDRWKIVYFHAGRPYGNETSQNKLFKLLSKLNVDVVMFGHSHWYDSGVKDGVRWFLIGSGGFGDNFCDPSHDPSFARFIVKGNNLLMSRFGFDFQKRDCRPDPYVDFDNKIAPPDCTAKWCGYSDDFYPTVPRELDRMFITRKLVGEKYTTSLDYHDFYQWSLADLATPKEIGSNTNNYNTSQLRKSAPPDKNQFKKNKKMRCKTRVSCRIQGFKNRYCWRPDSKLYKNKRGFCAVKNLL